MSDDNDDDDDDDDNDNDDNDDDATHSCFSRFQGQSVFSRTESLRGSL